MPDSRARKQALNPQHSFIVQAPAGSGKTELLTQRFLALLKVVEMPEEILAVTFTNKAAAEMKARIVMRLRANPEYDKWDILKNPNRLRIVTIDALCGYLSARLPLLSNFGCQPEITDEPSILFQAATEALLQTAELDSPWSEALRSILAHLDNRYDLAQNFFVKLLGKRDQWLDVINQVDGDLSEPLQRIIEQALCVVANKITPAQAKSLLHLLQHAWEHVPQDSPLKAFPYPDRFPESIAMDLPRWQALSYFITTQDGGFRKRVDKNLGFLAKVHQVEKDAMMGILSEFSHQYEPDLFYQIQHLPDPDYSSVQLNIINHLQKVLPALVGQLKVIFKERGQVDFIEVAEGASRALGELDAPSDLALSLDYQIKHILIDEFQDTSVAQFRLFERLVAEWMPDDGRTLFLVGDPMQSIYHFRGAEVGLFIRARQQGLGGIALTDLYLTQNFRSEPELVDNFNALFCYIFPREDDLALGAVKFHSATAAVQQVTEKSLFALPIFGKKQFETDSILKEIRAIQLQHPEYRIGILSRTKRQLNDILNMLRVEKMPFQAEQLEPLAEQQIILDLNAITMALLNPLDRLAWFSMLRAPWCGLKLHDLYHLQQSQHETVWNALNDAKCIDSLSDDAKSCINRISPLIVEWLAEKGRVSLRHWIEGFWLRVGGPACLNNMKEASIANAFFELLESMDEGGGIKDRALWDAKLSSLFLEDKVGEDSTAKVTLMTIHKAKGLEFDVVFLIGLEDSPGKEDSQLFLWFERPWEGGVDLLFAPKSEIGESDKLYDYIRQQIKIKKNLEQVRLLYVAMTRARKQLYLCARTERDVQKYTKGSFAHYLKKVFENTSSMIETENIKLPEQIAPDLKRLHPDWRFPITLKQPVVIDKIDLNQPEGLGGDFDHHRHVGSLVHQIFQVIADEGYISWQRRDIDPLQYYWRRALQSMGVAVNRVEDSVRLVVAAVQQFLSDQNIAWLFSPDIQHVQNEWGLCEIVNGRVRTHIIDRSFIDAADNRWIIDYKIIDRPKKGFNLEEELEKYLPQLNRYKNLLARYEQRPIYFGLYFPLEKIWWDNKTKK
jgi:ATP-dependent helicase/nuclease subunit A